MTAWCLFEQIFAQRDHLGQIQTVPVGLPVIDPLEVPPMGDCNLAELKRLHGRTLTLKGNLHTTEVMLRGTPDDVRSQVVNAISQTGGKRLIIGTGCVTLVNTPESNLRAARNAVER